jgi:hypothetical protein
VNAYQSRLLLAYAAAKQAGFHHLADAFAFLLRTELTTPTNDRLPTPRFNPSLAQHP